MFCEKDLNGVRIFSFSELDQIPHFICVVSSRQTDSELRNSVDSPDPKRRRKLSELLELEPPGLHTLRQVHSDQIVEVGQPCCEADGREIGPADGIICSSPGVYAAVRTADCLPIIVVSTGVKQAALIHMGWRGARSRILEKGARQLLARTGARPESVVTAFGPSIRRCCYEVGDEVREEFLAAGFDPGEVFIGRHLDLVAAAAIQLGAAGLRSPIDCGICTSCRTDQFYSYRREGTSSRLWTVAGFRPSR
jgi:YfiH family protein